MKKMTKTEFKAFARDRGFEARYSGKAKKFYLSKVGKCRSIHELINERASRQKTAQ